MILVLTMAGRYQRFANEGFKVPKYLLPWGDRTVLSVILAELLAGGTFSQVLLVANHRDEAYMPHVRAVMKRHGIPANHLLMTHDTSGQAETAMIGAEACARVLQQPGAPLVFHNIDTVLFKRNFSEMQQALASADGYIDVFRSSNRNYSYVLIDADRRVTEIAEKIVVSDLATSGLYGFASSVVFKEFYRPGEDLYVSAIYKRMITQGRRLLVGQVHHESDTVVLGTPDEYMNAALLML
jgi:dTDP-glucose pyrophosphorylase